MLIPFKRKQDPRKPVSGSSYSAAGTTAVPQGSDIEIGSSRSIKLVDVVPQLVTRYTQHKTYRQMVDNDASVFTSLRVSKVPVTAADYWIEPFSGDQEDRDIAEFVNFNIFHRPSAPWLLTLEEVLHMYEDGASIFEIVLENGEWGPKRPNANRKQYTMLKKLASRPIVTIKEIKYDNNGGPVAVIQNAVDANGKTNEKTLDMDRIIIFTLDRRGHDLFGRSLLRSAYKHWYYKDHLYKVDAIQKERHGVGIPEAELQPGFSADDKALAIELVQNLRANETAYVVRPVTLSISFLKPEGQMVDVLQSATHHDNMIMKNVMAQFMNLGLESGGGRATAGSQVDIFMKSLRHVANLICETINLHLIPKLVAYNFETDRFPKMQARNIGETKDTQAWAAAIANLFAQGAVTPDLPTEQWIRQQIDAPAKTEPYVTPTPNAQQSGFGNNNNNQNQNGNKNDVATGKDKGDVSNQIKTGRVGAPVNSG